MMWKMMANLLLSVILVTAAAYMPFRAAAHYLPAGGVFIQFGFLPGIMNIFIPSS